MSTTPDAPAGATPLSQRLRTETAELHRLAERSGIMHGLLRGRLDRGEYVELLRGLQTVYAALERRLHALAADPVVRPFFDEALLRTPALAADIRALHDGDATADAEVQAAAARYATRIDAASPAQLVAHAYVRYLGDLSGGQALGRVIAKALALPGDEGIAFYRFPGIPDPEAYKVRFRASLDAWPLSPAEADDVVREAQDAFRLNVTVFEAVGTRSAASDAPPPTPAA